MTHRLFTNYAKNYCNRTLIVKVIVENVVTCFFFGGGTQCSYTLVLVTNYCYATVVFIFCVLNNICFIDALLFQKSL